MFDAQDRRYMKRALALAEKGMGAASPNPSVGCVVVKAGKMIGKGYHEYALLDHAEVHALRESAGQARDATAYVTLEPCSHQGRTPPCADRLIEAGITRVVVARIDPNPRVSGQGIDRLRSAGIQVDVGLMAEEAGRIIEAFACRITTGLPLVVSKVGMSLDGKIGTASRMDRNISSIEGMEFGQKLRWHADALLVGVGTILADDPELTYRGKYPKARPLMRIILDTHLRTPSDARLLQMADRYPVLIFCAPDAPAARKAELEMKGAEILPTAASGDNLDLHSILRELGKRDVLSVLVEGGSLVHWSFLSEGRVDKFYFLVAPMVLGGKDAVPAVGGSGYDVIAESPRFKLNRSFFAGTDIVLETYPSYSRSIISPWLLSENAPSGALDPLRSSAQK